MYDIGLGAPSKPLSFNYYCFYVGWKFIILIQSIVIISLTKYRLYLYEVVANREAGYGEST